jgi:hypothetical protein
MLFVAGAQLAYPISCDVCRLAVPFCPSALPPVFLRQKRYLKPCWSGVAVPVIASPYSPGYKCLLISRLYIEMRCIETSTLAFHCSTITCCLANRLLCLRRLWRHSARTLRFGDRRETEIEKETYNVLVIYL